MENAESKKNRKWLWLWILGWIFIFPVPLTIVLVRNKKFPKIIKVIILIIAYLFYLLILSCACATSNDTIPQESNVIEEQSINKTIVEESAVNEPTIDESIKPEEIKQEEIVVLAESIKIKQIDELHKDDSIQLEVEILPEDTTNKDVVWTTSNENVITINKTGVIEVVNYGTAIITASIDDVSDSIEISIIEPKVEITTEQPIQDDNSTTSTEQTVEQPVEQIIDQPVEQNNSITVYVTNSGKKYHKDGCRYLKDSCIPMSLDDAKAQGYEPCGTCYK